MPIDFSETSHNYAMTTPVAISHNDREATFYFAVIYDRSTGVWEHAPMLLIEDDPETDYFGRLDELPESVDHRGAISAALEEDDNEPLEQLIYRLMELDSAANDDEADQAD